jgi:aminopeptidase-like protein
MLALARRLYPICRSITGDGVRATFDVLRSRLPLHVHEVPSGTTVFDWTVPKEWNIRDAYVADASGRRVIDFRQHNLHVMQYSVPVRARMSLDELQVRLHSLPDRPDAIPYRTTYHSETWGFCLADRQRRSLAPGEYEVVIDSTLANGHLTYAECLVPGARPEEVLIHAHVCHPSLANDNLSGVVVAAFLGEFLLQRPRCWSYRLVFLPGLIGPLTWLSRNHDARRRIRHGLVLTGLGDPSPLTYKRSRLGDAPIDEIMAQLLSHREKPGRLTDFEPYGYDERQYCSPGFNLPVGALMRALPGTYPEYHTSDDNLDFIRAESLADALAELQRLTHVLETDRVCRNAFPMGEPQLGRRGLFRATGGTGIDDRQMARLWVLNLSDGSHSLTQIATRARLPYGLIEASATELEDAKLIARLPSEDLETP